MLTKVDDKVMLSDGAYSFGKKLVQIYLPATSAAYFGLAGVWGLPYVAQVIGTIAVLSTFFGVVLGISSKQYDSSDAAFDGTVGLVENNEGTAVKFSLDPGEVVTKDSIKLKVVAEDPLGNKKSRKRRK